jgi:hypothetical protein
MLFKQQLLFASFLVTFFAVVPYSMGNEPETKVSVIKEHWLHFAGQRYAILKDSTLSFDAFAEGLQGYFLLKNKGRVKNDQYLTVIDFSQPSSQKRFYLIDVHEMRIVHKTYCSHGKNTGGLHANSFSNDQGSNQSSLGFYITGETYTGKFNLGMRLDGIEDCNSRARDRGVVMHGAEYATESFMRRNNNVLGRSFGCPAVPMKEAPQLIHKIKGGSVLYIYHPNKHYHFQSKILNNFDMELKS